MKYNIPKVSIFSILIAIALLNLKCDKKEDFYFPYVKVDMMLNIYTDLFDLGNLSAKAYPDNGIGGIIIFKYEPNYFAFDMACTHEIPDKVCSIEEYNNSSIVWKCPCCNSRFTIDISGIAYVSNDGGPAKHSLQSYHTYTDGTYVYVSN